VSVAPEAVGAAGVGIGLLVGLFGVGGSAFATPVLALLGVPAFAAVASPLPATIPASLAGAWVYVRNRQLDWSIAWRTIVGGVPAVIAGALLSQVVGGRALLALSGVALGVVGVTLLRSGPAAATADAPAHERHPGLIILYAAGVGLFTGLLANGGGFLLVPLYVVVLGLSMQRAAGTSLAVVATLAVPTLITHWALGHIDWPVALVFAAGAIPGAVVGSRLAQRVASAVLRTAFAWLLIVFAGYFVARQLLAL